MKNAQPRQMNYGSLKSEKARALVSQLQQNRFKRNPLTSRILVAAGTALALLVVGAMLTKIKNPTSAEIQKETSPSVEESKKIQTKKRIRELQEVLEIRAHLKDRLTWMNDPETEAEQLKEEKEEETEELKERLSLLQNHLKELDWDLEDAKDEQWALFDKLLAENPITKETDSKYETVSARLTDMMVLREKIEATIQKTEEELKEVQVAWLTESPEYALDLHGVGYRINPEGGF